MKKNRFFNLLLAAMAIFTLSFVTSCDEAEVEESGSPSLELSTASLAFDAFGESTDDLNGQVVITSNRDWTVEIPSTKDWLFVDVASGSGNGTITFSMSETTTAREAIVPIKLYNDSGYILEESVTITQAGSNGGTDITGGTARLDGSELPTSYSEDSTITVDDVDFIISFVANFTESYPDSTGPIQFSKSGSYLYNTTAFEDLRDVVVVLSNTYNNFTVFAGSEANPQTTEVTGSTNGSAVTYTVPEGTTFVAIYNNTDYTAYADTIEFLCGDDESEYSGGSTGGGATGNTIAAAANADNAGSSFDLTGTVVAKTTAGYLLGDDTGYVYVYLGSTTTFELGDIVNIVGETTSYAGLGQFTSSATATKTGSETLTYPTPIEMSGSDLDDYLTDISTKYVKYTGTLSVSGNYTNITIDGASSATGSISYPESDLYDSSLVGQVVDVYGYIAGVSGTVYVQTIATCIVAEGGEFYEPGTGSGSGEEEEIPTVDYTGIVNASDFGVDNATAAPDMIFGVYKFEWDRGTNSSNSPTYYTSGDAVRMYVGNTLTISTTDGSSLENIDMTFVSDSYSNLSTETGSYDSATGAWSGDATSVTFTSLDDDSTSSYEQSRIVSVVINGEQGGEEPEEPESEDPADIVFDANSGFPTSGDAEATVYTLNGASFAAQGLSYSESYGNYTMSNGGYLYNLTELIGLSKIVIDEDGSYYNYTLYAGTELNPLATEVSYTKEGNLYTYEIPEGCTFFTIGNSSGYGAYGTSYSLYFDSLGDTAELPSTGGGEEPEEPETPTYDYTGIVNASDFGVDNGVDAPDAIFGVYKFEWALGTNTSNTPKYYTSGDAIRMYGGNTLTISTTDGSALNNIQFTFTGDSYNNLATETGSYSETGLWSGDATSVTFTSVDSQSRIVSIVVNGEVVEEGGDDAQSTLVFDAATGFPATGDSEDTVYVVNDASFVAKSLSYSSSYGNYTLGNGGHLYNLTELIGLSKIVIDEDGSYYNYTIYAGSEVNPSTEISYTKEGNLYTYEIPEGCTYFTIGNSSGYGAYGTSYTLYYDSLGDTADFEANTTTDAEYTYAEILAAMGKTADDVDSSAGLAVVDAQFDSFTLTSDKGTTSTAFRLWASDSSIRSYAGNTVTVTAKDGKKVKSVVFSASEITEATAGEFSSNSWSGEASDVTLTLAKATNYTITVVVE